MNVWLIPADKPDAVIQMHWYMHVCRFLDYLTCCKIDTSETSSHGFRKSLFRAFKHTIVFLWIALQSMGSPVTWLLGHHLLQRVMCCLMQMTTRTAVRMLSRQTLSQHQPAPLSLSPPPHRLQPPLLLLNLLIAILLLLPQQWPPQPRGTPPLPPPPQPPHHLPLPPQHWEKQELVVIALVAVPL